MPINVENPNKYKRGSFEFNVCFIVSGQTFENNRNHQIISMSLKKIASALTQLELERDYLSCWLAGSAKTSDLKDSQKQKVKENLQGVIK